MRSSSATSLHLVLIKSITRDLKGQLKKIQSLQARKTLDKLVRRDEIAQQMNDVKICVNEAISRLQVCRKPIHATGSLLSEAYT